MSLIYLDTSALVKRLAVEVESVAFLEFLVRNLEDGNRLVSSVLTEVELGRFASRTGIDQSAVDDVLAAVSRVSITSEVIDRARRHPAMLKSLDAIHLATAHLLAADPAGGVGVSVVVTYDQQFGRAALDAGFQVLAPGSASPMPLLHHTEQC